MPRPPLAKRGVLSSVFVLLSGDISFPNFPKWGKDQYNAGWAARKGANSVRRPVRINKPPPLCLGQRGHTGTPRKLESV